MNEQDQKNPVITPTPTGDEVTAPCCRYLQQQIDQGRRSLRIGAVVMVIIAAALLFIFGRLRGQVAVALAPANLATFAVSEVRRSLPAARDALEDSLRKAAPDIVAFVGDTVVNETVPVLRVAVERMFRDYARELTHYSVQATEGIFEQIIGENRDELRARAHAAPGVYTADRLAADLDRTLTVQIDRRLTSQPHESTRFKLDRSVAALKNINHRLQQMASNKANSRKDRLGRKLITTWWTLLQRTDVQQSASDRMLQQAKVPQTPVPASHAGP